MILALAVIYLARPADGIRYIERFARSYRRNSADCQHDLVVIAKGCNSQEERLAIAEIFRGIAAKIIDVTDDGRDIQAYLAASQNLPYSHLCFFNTFTVLQTSSWLKHLFSAASRPGVGLAGATASFESIYDTTRFITKATWLTTDRKIRFNARLAAQLAWHLDVHAPAWMAARGSLAARIKRAVGDLLRRKPGTNTKLDEEFEKFWLQMTQSGSLAHTRDFPRFPNPHIRTNGFLISRDLLVGFDFNLKPDKESCAQFESGEAGLTHRVRASGLKPLLIGADGRSFDLAEWPKSDGFRLGDQRNVIAADNQVLSFSESDEWQRAWLTRVSWGDYAGSVKNGFVSLGHEFPARSLDVQSLA